MGVMTAWEDPCRRCGFNEEGGCTCPPSERWYACPSECRKPENVRDLEQFADWAYEKGKEVGLWHY